jgi:hypothetical protein
MRPQPALVLACLCALVATPVGAGEPRAETQPEPAVPESPQQADRHIDAYRREAWRWQRVMGRPLTRALGRSSAKPAERISAWRRVAIAARRRAQRPPHKRAWLCIQRYEGRWNDPNPPYYGGLQMDLGFQRRYGRALLARKGTADRWTPLEQMWAAERAHRAGRGFWPWPNTARFCGLL